MDADQMIYQIAAACEEATDWGDDVWTLHSDAREARDLADDKIARIQGVLDADQVVVCFSDPTGHYWRHDLYEGYKGNRAGVRKPLCLKPLREYLEETYPSYVRETLEADDIIGVLATSKKLIPGKKVIVATDKDFDTIPAPRLDLGDLDGPLKEVSRPQADYWHLFQTLTGDTTDGFSGCPGIGPKKAEKVLYPLEERTDNQVVPKGWPLVVEAFDKAGFGEEEALLQARLARICRVEDYDFENRKVKLWEPTTKT